MSKVWRLIVRLLKILFWFCLIIFVIALFVFTIQCIFSAWWNILLLLIILLTLWWYKIRRKTQKSVLQGVLVILLSLLLLSWYLIPCIFGHFNDLEEEAETDTEKHRTTPLTLVDKQYPVPNHHQVLTDDEEEKEKKQKAEKEKRQAVKEKEEQEQQEQQACLNIRGNVSSSGDKIYHVPSGQFYDKTEPEETFCTEAEAKSAGYRKSKL